MGARIIQMGATQPQDPQALEYNQLIEYKIEGTANDGDNWTIVERTDIKK